MVRRFAQTNDADACHWVAWTCALAPEAVSDFAGALALANKMVKSNPKSSCYLNTFGAILYRAGQLEEAIQRLTEANQLLKDGDPNPSVRSSPAYTWFFLAMAHHASGHHDEAKKWLDKAGSWTDRVLREHEDGTGAKLPWNRRLTLKLLREEAQELLKPSGASQQSKPPDEKEKTDSEDAREKPEMKTEKPEQAS